MAHEELKKQYEEDCKNYERPWELWEQKHLYSANTWVTCLTHPLWRWKDGYEYRRKNSVEPASFRPEYFSGLNWRDAEKLVGRVVEFSDNGDGPWEVGELHSVGTNNSRKFFIKGSGFSWEYIRTCPETYAHPTITIGGVELPRPEVEELKYDTAYWTWTPTGGVNKTVWQASVADREWLRMKIIHLTEPRAQAWASWWNEVVIKAINETNT